MDFKKIRRGIGRFFGWWGLNFCSLIIRFIPKASLYSFAECLASLGYCLARKQRKAALDSLNIAFGQQKLPQEKAKIAKDSFTFMAKAGVEILSLMDRPQALKERIHIAGKEKLESVLAAGKGVILVSAHFGNFPLMLARISLEGYKISGIMRYMRDERIEKFFLAKRERFKIKTIYSQPRKACVENSIHALRENELIFILVDQNFGSGGVFVDFFGRKAATATGPIILSRRTGAAILPCFIIRQSDDTHKIIFEPPINLEENKLGKEAVLINIQRLTDIIEAYIRKYPAHWSWIHRRWKSRPNLEGGA